jgi:hypothetical protein
MFDQVVDTDLSDFSSQDADDFLSDVSDVRGWCVGGFFSWFQMFFTESDHENSHYIPINCFDIDESFDERLPFSDHGEKFIPGDVHTVKRGFGVMSFDFINDQSYFSPFLFKYFNLPIQIFWIIFQIW